jgi:hypothetical protein
LLVDVPPLLVSDLLRALALVDGGHGEDGEGQQTVR